jgi:phage-related protein
MKLKIEYESKTVMPDEIKKLLDTHRKKLLEFHNEQLNYFVADLFYETFSWFADRAKDDSYD